MDQSIHVIHPFSRSGSKVIIYIILSIFVFYVCRTAEETHEVKPLEERPGGVTGEKRTETPSDPTQPIFMVGERGA